MNLEKRLSNARLSLLLDFPFFGQLALRMDAIIDPSVDTACTDGRTIRFNPTFCNPLSDQELTFLYGHEVAHPALGHLWRIKGLDPRKANRAADYVVNEMFHKIIMSQKGAQHRLKLIKGSLLDPQYYGLSMEEIYRLLPADDSSQPDPLGTFIEPAPQPAAKSEDKGKGDEPEDGNGEGDSDGDGDGDGDGSGSGQSQSDTLEQEWKDATAAAATVARSRNQGHLPGDLGKTLAKLAEPEVPWQDLLRQFAARICRDDYSFRRPNRRFAHQGIMLPSLRSEGLGVIVVAVDTSGSIRSNQKLLNAFLTELQSILDTTRPEVIHMIDCDARVQAHHEFRQGDDLRKTQFGGGGGTDFRPVFNYVEKHDLNPACLIYLTDLYGDFPANPPPYPTLWLNYDDPRTKVPFGQNIHVKQP